MLMSFSELTYFCFNKSFGQAAFLIREMLMYITEGLEGTSNGNWYCEMV